MQRIATTTILAALTVFLGASAAPAQVITFDETSGGGVPVDNSALGLNDGFAVGPVTVTFGFDTDTDGTTETEAFFENAGIVDAMIGFFGSAGINTADPGFEGQLGTFFLRGEGLNIIGQGGGPFGHFVIDYDPPTIAMGASGEIWDVDSQVTTNWEQYRVRAFDVGGTMLDEQLSPIGVPNADPSSLDGRPWTFSFDGLSAAIAKITIEYIGTKPDQIGLAFNNFNALLPAVPVESTSWSGVKRRFGRP